MSNLRLPTAIQARGIEQDAEVCGSVSTIRQSVSFRVCSESINDNICDGVAV